MSYTFRKLDAFIRITHFMACPFFPKIKRNQTGLITENMADEKKEKGRERLK